MVAFIYLSVAFLAVSGGFFYTRFLVAHPLKMSRNLLFSCLALSVLVMLIINRVGGIHWLWGSLLAVLGFISGYLVSARIELGREDTRQIPPLTRQPTDAGLGHTAVIYFTHGEPETYDPIGWINQFNEFDRQKIPFVPFFARPFFLHALRKKYLKVGKSEHRMIHQRMIAALEKCFRDRGDTHTRFYLSFLDDNPRPDVALIQALNDGASRLIICEVFLTISNHTAEGNEMIQEILQDFPAIPTISTGPLFDSILLRDMFVQRANQHKNHYDKSKIGVLLVGHGQPDEWDVEWPTETEHEIGFRLDVLKTFEADGYRKENLSLAWMEFKQPKPAPKIEEFVRNGVEEILYFPAAISADSLHSQYDIPELIHAARVPEGLPLVNLQAWNDDPLVIQALLEKIDSAWMKLESEARAYAE